MKSREEFKTDADYNSYLKYYFAGLAMQGILSNRELQISLFMDLEIDKKIFPNINHQNAIAIHAVKEAEELLKQLNICNSDDN